MRRHELIRPLSRFSSIKLRIGALVIVAIAVTVAVFYVGVHSGFWPSVSGILAGAIALVMVRFLAHGITTPLTEMAEATEAMARGDYSRRVHVTSRDEVGTLAQSFNQMVAELEATDRIRRDLVANVSHELRTPITALQARLENLVDGVEQTDPETLAAMLAQVERLGRLVTQLLDLSRLESGSVPLDRQAFAVGPVLTHVVRESRLNAPDIDVTVQVQPESLTADGDAERVHQVVANLVENAVRHSPCGGAITVAAQRDDQSVRIEVTDEGPGIPDAETTRIFERFYRSDSARAAQDGGAGLGLAIAQWIVELHGGEIHPEQRRPHGCRMVVTIPAAAHV